MNENTNWLMGGGNDAASSVSSSINDSSILRTSKTKAENPIDDLLIFGYACKIFRDDDKARYIDQGKHLIPWMGDSTLKIDRYDVRGALTDISRYEAPAGGYDNRLDYLTPEEQRAEQLCEQERYYSLYNNDVEEELYKEEELKRLKASYGQVAFNYDAEAANKAEEVPETADSAAVKDNEKNEPPDEVYVPHPKFIIPTDIELPETVKIHAIIERTAKFISTQGPQMEILIKAKQSNNPQFEFLNRNSRLNCFYKHMLQCMKNGTYPEEPIPGPSTDNPNDDQSTSNETSNLYASSVNMPKISVPTLKYKPSADCAYTQLISKIKGVPILTEKDLDELKEALGTQSPNPTSNASSPSINANENPPKFHATKNDVEVKKISSGLMLAQYYNSDSESENEETPTAKSTETENFTLNENSQSSLPLHTQENETNLGIPCPPPDLKVIIEKTAAYVLKNGKDFEDILRTKNDTRFTFLQYTDQYYKYYTYKVTGVICTTPPPPPIVHLNNGATQINQTEKFATSNVVTRDESRQIKSSSNLETNSKTLTPVSFCIKTKDEPTGSLPIKPALPQEQSSDEDEGSKAREDSNANKDNHTQSVPTTTTPPAMRTVQQSFYPPLPTPHCHKVEEVASQFNGTHQRVASSVQNVSSSNVTLDESRGSEVDQSDSFIRDSMLEQQNIEERKEAKRAEEKVKDRLAQLAREKLGILSKEKQLQLERKRRAMAFLNQVQAPTASTSDNPVTTLTSTSTISALDQIRNNNMQTDSDSNSSDSVTIINSSPTPGMKRPRNLRTKADDDEDDDDIIEIVPIQPGSRSRSKSTSSRHRLKHKKSKHSKKKSRRKRSQSRSRSPSRKRAHSRTKTARHRSQRSYSRERSRSRSRSGSRHRRDHKYKKTSHRH